MNIATLTAQYRADTSHFDQGTERVRSQLGGMGSAFERFGGVAGRVFVGMLAWRGLSAIFEGVAAGFRSITVEGLKFHGLIEQATIGFTTMLGSGEKATAFLKDLQQFARTTPFQFQDLVQASQRMLALGFSAQQVRPLLEAVGETTAALGTGKEGLDRIILALGQMSSKTKVQAEEMRQLTEAGVSAWPLLARTLGTDVAGAMDAVTKRTVDAKVFLDAFMRDSVSRLGGMMQAQSRTFVGAVSNIHDSIQALRETAFKPLYEVVTSLGVRLADLLGSDEADRWAIGFAAGLKDVIDQMRFLFRSIQQFTGAGDDRRFTILRRLGIDPASAREIIGILNGLSRDIPGTLLRIGRLALDAFERTFGPFGAIIQNTLEMQVRRPMLTWVAENVEKFAANAGTLLTAFFDVFSGRGGRGQVGGLDPYVQRVEDAFGNALGAIGDWLGNTGLPNLKQKLGGFWYRFWQGGALGTDAQSKIGLLGVNVQQGLEDSFGAVSKEAFGTGLRGQIEEMLAPLLDWGRQAKDAGTSFITGLIEGINSKIADLQTTLQNIVNLVNGVVGGINTAIAGLNAALGAIPKMPGAPGAPPIPTVPTVPGVELPQVPALPTEPQPPPQPQPPSPPPPAPAPAPPAPAIQLPQLPTPQLPQIEIPDPIEAARRAAEAAKAAWDAFIDAMRRGAIGGIGGMGPGPGQPVAPLSPPALPPVAAPTLPVGYVSSVPGAAFGAAPGFNPATAGFNQWEDFIKYYAAQYAPPGVDPATFAYALRTFFFVEHRGAPTPAALTAGSPAGAYGIGQAMPNWYRQVGGDPTQLPTQVQAAAAALASSFQAYGPNPINAVTGYYGRSAEPYYADPRTGKPVLQGTPGAYFVPATNQYQQLYAQYWGGAQGYLPLPAHQPGYQPPQLPPPPAGYSPDLTLPGVAEAQQLPDATVPATQNRVQAAQAIIAKAAQYLGVAYKLGGTDFSGIDCSNLVQQAYSAAGLSLPAPTYSQFNESQVIPQSEARPGDLVFFKNTYTPEGLGWIKKTYGEQAAQFTHVGLYLGEQNGQPMMLDASGNKVAYHNINDPYWQAHSPTFARPNVLAGLPDAFQKVTPTVEANTAAIQMLTDAIRGLMGLPGIHGAPPPPPVTPPVTPLSIAEAVANRLTDIHETQPQGAAPFADQMLSGLVGGRKSFPWQQFDSAAASELYQPLRAGAENMVLGALREVIRQPLLDAAPAVGQKIAETFVESAGEQLAEHPLFDPKAYSPVAALATAAQMGVPDKYLNQLLGIGRTPISGADNPLLAANAFYSAAAGGLVNLGDTGMRLLPGYPGGTYGVPTTGGQPGYQHEVLGSGGYVIGGGGYSGAPTTGGGLGGTQQGQVNAPADPRVVSLLEGILRAVQEGQTVTIDGRAIGSAARDFETQESRLVYG